MVTYKRVFWTEPARDNLFQVYQRLAAKSPERAQEWIAKVLESTASLEKNYPQGAAEPLLRNEKVPYKFITVGFYKIVYSIEEEDIFIKTLYHSRQDPVV